MAEHGPQQVLPLAGADRRAQSPEGPELGDDLEQQSESTTDSVAWVPELFPLPRAAVQSFAEGGGYAFGWTKRQFRILRPGWTLKTVHEFPLTEDGWAAAWQTMSSRYPKLAHNVDARIAPERHLPPVDEAKLELDRLATYRVVDDCTLLGGYGWQAPDFVPGRVCVLRFTEEGLWAHSPSSWVPLIRSPYHDAVALEFSGPGLVTSGARVFGGGFGLVGAAGGILASAVLNSLTKRTSIHTIIRYQAVNMEAFFFHSRATPDQLRVALSQVLSHIGPRVPSSADSLSSELSRLAELHKSGAVTDEEFAALKARLISGQ